MRDGNEKLWNKNSVVTISRKIDDEVFAISSSSIFLWGVWDIPNEKQSHWNRHTVVEIANRGLPVYHFKIFPCSINDRFECSRWMITRMWRRDPIKNVYSRLCKRILKLFVVPSWIFGLVVRSWRLSLPFRSYGRTVFLGFFFKVDQSRSKTVGRSIKVRTRTYKPTLYPPISGVHTRHFLSSRRSRQQAAEWGRGGGLCSIHPQHLISILARERRRKRSESI